MRPLSLAAIAAASTCLTLPAIAQDKSEFETVLSKVAETYDTDRLERARTIRFMEDRRLPYYSLDYGTDFHDVTRQRRFDVVDLNGQRRTSEYQTAIHDNFWHGRSINTNGEQIFIDYFSGKYEDQGEIDFSIDTGTVIRNYDTSLALFLIQNREDAEFFDHIIWLGKPHSRIKISQENQVDKILYVDDETGFITRMDRLATPQVTIHYSYDNHKIQDGIPISTESTIFQNDEPIFFNFNRQVGLNVRADQRAFEIERSVVLEPERMDQSAMTVEPIGSIASRNLVFHVGVDEQYSTIFQTPEGLIIYGTYAGLSDRLAAYRERTGDQAGLRYAIVPDHHQADLAGIPDALAEGATLLTTADARPRAEDAAGETISAERVQIVTDDFTIGTVKVMKTPTSHASQVLFAYDAASLTFAQSEHYYALYADEEYYVRHTGIDMLEFIQKNQLRVAHIAANTNRKVEQWDDFLKAVEKYNDAPCLYERPLCKTL